MPEDRSLDEFARGDVDEERGDSDPRKGRSDAIDAESAVDATPATSTATWTTDGAACDRCGESVTRRWTDGDALVCAACKEW